MLKKCTCVIMSLVMTFSLCSAISFAEVGSSGFQVTKKTLTEEEVPDVYVQYLIDQGLVDCIDYDNMERLITVSEFTNLINSVAVEVKDSCPYSLYHSDNDKTLYLDEAIKLLSDESSPEVKYIIEQWVAADMDTTSFLTMYDAIKLISTYRALCTDIDPTITYMVMEPVFLDPVEFNEKNPEEMKALQNSSILMTLRGQKNVQNSFQQIEKDIDNSMKMLKNGKDNFSKASPNTNSSPYGLTLGSNATYTTCNFWNYGLTSATGTVYSSYAAKALRARSREIVQDYGSGSSWALTGVKVKMNGTGTQTATVKYTGSYSGEMVPGFLGGTTGVIGNLVVRDMTTEQIIASRTAINETLQNHNGLSYYTNTQSLTSTVPFTAGHTYVIYFSVGASASEFLGEMICTSDFFTPDTDYDFGARMNSIKITF